ncbi:hypothetical protein EVAR_87377_1 [Eumeta japonica]|uniref:Mariner Mos1 transposase n=1 Tax=Eumeta variegata TaxID=151549 RepID=A0A4C1XZP6_EUMVA|nr:hypothetical protein EVAR_87377_1 [Eumeta japonica]
MHMHNEVLGHASPIKMYATHMCNGCTTYKIQREWCIRYSCQPTVIPCEARLNKEFKSERKRCPSFNRRHIARNPLNQKRAVVKRSNPRDLLVVTQMLLVTGDEFTITVPKPKDSLLSLEILAHPSYSPDLAPCDFNFFRKINEKPQGKWFTEAENAMTPHEQATETVPKCEWAKCSVVPSNVAM